MTVIIMRTPGLRQRAVEAVQASVVDEDHPLVMKIVPLGRTLEQNALLWPLLTEFSNQLQWSVNGAMCTLTKDEWKDILTAGFNQERARLADGLDGGVVMLGSRTAEFSKRKFSEFIEFIYAVGAQRGVRFQR